jgi:uncharacterized repeat protein (TIGR01451 family)
MPVGGSATVTVVLRPTAPGELQSTVAVKGAEPDASRTNNRAKSTAVVIPAADLSVTASASKNPVPIGQKLVYTYDLANKGPSPAHDLTLTVVLPPGVSVGPAEASSGRCNTSPVSVVCRFETVEAGAGAKASIEVKPWSTGRATAPGEVTLRETDPNHGDTAIAAETTVVPSVNLGVKAKVTPAVVLAGGELTYEVYVTNSGISPATGVTLTNRMPEGTSLVSATAVSPAERASACRAQDGVVTCTLGGIGVRERARVMLVLRVDAPGRLTTRFEAQAAELDEARRDNVAKPVASVAGGSAGSPGRRY